MKNLTIETGKKYVTDSGVLVSIIHKMEAPCSGYGRFIGIVENGYGSTYCDTFSEDGESYGHFKLSLKEEAPKYFIEVSEDRTTFLKEVTGSLESLKEAYGNVYIKV